MYWVKATLHGAMRGLVAIYRKHSMWHPLSWGVGVGWGEGDFQPCNVNVTIGISDGGHLRVWEPGCHRGSMSVLPLKSAPSEDTACVLNILPPQHLIIRINSSAKCPLEYLKQRSCFFLNLFFYSPNTLGLLNMYMTWSPDHSEYCQLLIPKSAQFLHCCLPITR